MNPRIQKEHVSFGGIKLMKLLNTTLALAFFANIGCGGHGAGSYSLLASGSTFHQNSASQNTKIDVLWVIDNSGSMDTSQRNLASNFNSFITEFSKVGYDFQLGVTTTQAYLANSIWTPYYNSSPRPVYYENQAQANIAKLRDGIGSNHSGYFILDAFTPNLAQNFVTNALQGVNGNGDERSFESMETTLLSSLNNGFLRAGAFLAVIILTDEDDFSNGVLRHQETYDSALTPLDHYTTLLNNLTGSTDQSRHYNVSTIAIQDEACRQQIYSGAQKIGQRVNALADLTGGTRGNICGDFAQELKLISQQIVKLSSQFYLGNAKPIASTIKVYINGVQAPRVESNPNGDGGWAYNQASNSIVFDGAYVPPQGAAINVTFDPESVTF